MAARISLNELSFAMVKKRYMFFKYENVIGPPDRRNWKHLGVFNPTGFGYASLLIAVQLIEPLGSTPAEGFLE